MRKNVFLKSTLRQLLRTLLLVLLIGAASFAFVLRSVEYLVVRGQITEISQHYRSIGFLSAAAPHLGGDVSRAADILADSPFVDFEDRRHAVEGLLVGMKNADILLPPSVHEFPHQFAFVYGTLHEIDNTSGVAMHGPVTVNTSILYFFMEGVAWGYPAVGLSI